jgi:acyl dehydratase
MADDIFTLEFDALEVGMAFVTRGRTITETDVVSFAALSGDWHPQHVDRVWARQSPFGQRIAHGLLLLSYATGLVPLDPDRVLALRRIQDVTFKRPVCLGDTVHVEGDVAALQPIDDGAGLVSWRWSVINASGQTAVRARVQALWRRGPLQPAGAPDDQPERATTNGSHPSLPEFTPVPL